MATTAELEVYTTVKQFGSDSCRRAYRANLEGIETFAFMQDYAKSHRETCLRAGVLRKDPKANSFGLVYCIKYNKAVEVGERMMTAGRALYAADSPDVRIG